MTLTTKLVAGLLAAAMAGPVAAQAVEGPKVFWKLSLWGNPRAFTAGIEAVADHVREQTGGNFDIKIFYGNQLSNSRENLDGLKLNAFEAAGTCNFYSPGKNPAWMVFSLPFLPLGDPETSRHIRSKLYEHPAIVADMAQWNAVPYVSGYLPRYEFMGRGDAPVELDGWTGLRVRAGGGIGDAMEVLGATKQTLPAGETSTAFQRGALDAASFPHTYGHVAFSTADVADWYTANLNAGTNECGYVFNKTSFDALPPQYQQLLMDSRDIAFTAADEAYKTADAKNIPNFESSLQKIEYTPEQLAEFQERAGQPVWDEWVAANKDSFDAQGLLDLVFELAKEVEKTN